MASKFHNVSDTRGALVFASKSEARRYDELCLLVRAGEISDLKCQTSYELQKGFKHNGKKIRPIVYRADFSYVENGVEVAEDVKARDRRSGAFVTTPLFDVKFKLLLFTHPDLDFRLVEA